MPTRKVRFDDILAEDKAAKKRSAVSSDEEECNHEDRPFLGIKRARRGRPADYKVDEDEEDMIDDGSTELTSLEVEGIAVEPFHMKNENNDGTGYFDGDTYVFRKKNFANDEEPDAWLDQLAEDDDDEPSKNKMHRKDSSTTVCDPVKIQLAKTAQNPAKQKQNMDDLSELELYAKIRPHLGNDHETIMEAISRYGGLLKAESVKARQLAKEAFDDLTEGASAFMLRGNINIYQMKRSQMPHQSFHTSSTCATALPIANESPVQWQYKGSADGEIHGPYSTRDMLNWVQAGYFVGPSAVLVRTIETTEPLTSSSTTAATTTKAAISTGDDLLSDLMDDDDSDSQDHSDEAISTTGRQMSQGSSTTWGKWQMSDQVDFGKYLSSSGT
jgi:GYF domain